MDDLVIVANRLPVEVSAEGMSVSPGGLVSAMSAVAGPGSQWIGWGGPDAATAGAFDLEQLRVHPVELSPGEVARYYRGFSNAVLWPLFHGRLRQLELSRRCWRTYRVVNERFAARAAAVAPPGATVWVHDYHLLLVPELLRARRPDLRIGLFLHIPFPNAQLFASLPWRKEVLSGMLGADVVGFQVRDDVDNFVTATERLLGTGRDGDALVHGGRRVVADAFPISVDFERWNALGQRAVEEASQLRSDLGADTVFLGIDRLDYTKGIAQRLRAFGELLDQGLLDPNSCSFVQVAVPSRTDVPGYRDERDDVTAQVSDINAKHARTGSSRPVVYMESSLDDVGMAAWYRAADALVVTSLADGMNLVAKEFVAARGDLTGVLVLSEFAGASHDLPRAIIVNPYDIEEVKDALVAATEMPVDDRVANMTAMRESVRANDVHRWARSFLDRLAVVAGAAEAASGATSGPTRRAGTPHAPTSHPHLRAVGES